MRSRSFRFKTRIKADTHLKLGNTAEVKNANYVMTSKLNYYILYRSLKKSIKSTQLSRTSKLRKKKFLDTERT